MPKATLTHLFEIIEKNKKTEYVETLVKPGDLITIEFDAQERDRYRRLLGYVYFSNGKMLNEEIVKIATR